MWTPALDPATLSRLALLAGLLVGAAAAPGAAQTADDRAKISNAMSAAPPEIARAATIKDWPAKEGGALRTLREGTSDWVCLPDDPHTKGNDPMCLDRQWQAWLPVFLGSKEPPAQSGQAGIGYMLSSNSEASNTDPTATGPRPGNHWHRIGPHVMLILPGPKALEGLPTEPRDGAPYVMFPGTPLAHVMVPLAHEPMRH